MDYFEKLEKNPYEDLKWNIPEQRKGAVNVIGGNAQSFRTEIKVAEYLNSAFPIAEVGVILPEALKEKLPELPNLKFLASTESGSFADAEGLTRVFNVADYNLLLGDLSKNTITEKAVASACENSEKPLLITRDSVDAVAGNMRETLLLNEKLVFFASVVQLTKLLRAVYYPKMLLMTQSLVQVTEVLHKFTLSYPVGIITLHNAQVLVAQNGVVKAIPLDTVGCTPIMFWQGEIAARVIAMNLYNPNNFIKASVAGVYHNPQGDY